VAVEHSSHPEGEHSLFIPVQHPSAADEQGGASFCQLAESIEPVKATLIRLYAFREHVQRAFGLNLPWQGKGHSLPIVTVFRQSTNGLLLVLFVLMVENKVGEASVEVKVPFQSFFGRSLPSGSHASTERP
jgi:hypothetical protein